MTEYNLGLVFHEADFGSIQEYETIKFVISGIIKILEYQLTSRMGNLKVPNESDISIAFYSPKSVEALDPFNDQYVSTRHSNDVTFRDTSMYYKNEFNYRKKFDPLQFKDLAIANVEVVDGIPFALPVFDIRKISSSRIREVRDILLDMYYEGLKAVIACFDGDISNFENTFKSVKSQNWYLEKPIGDIVQSRGNAPSKAQLIVRWEPDYIYHTARIFNDDGSTQDILFMIYWRLIGSNFFNHPGRLSWVNKETLKYIPKSRDDYRFVFDVNKGPIDFSYYFEPPRNRADTFYTHLLRDHEDGSRKILYLN